MKHLAFFTVLIAWMAVFAMPTAKAEVVVRPQWTAEQVDGQVQWYYYWHGQKYHVDPAGQHWAILATVCVPVDNSFAPRMGGPVRHAAAGLHGRLSNLADRLACR
jgi:hypothetical protein